MCGLCVLFMQHRFSEIHETQLGSFLFSWWQTVLKKSCQSVSKVYTVYPRNGKRSQLMSGLFIICFYFICPLEAQVFNCSVITHPLRILSTSAPEMDTYALLQWEHHITNVDTEPTCQKCFSFYLNYQLLQNNTCRSLLRLGLCAKGMWVKLRKHSCC